MDIEHLTKTQIILLTLLVSFMTSIATGIVTVSLLQQAPPPVTQTINRVVERTVERVVETKKDKTGNTVTNEKTVVVKETDLIADAVKATMPSVVAVYKVPAKTAAAAATKETAATTGTTATPPVETQTAAVEDAKPTFVGRGVFVADNMVATDAALLEEGATYRIVMLATGASVDVVSAESKNGIAYLAVPSKTGQGIKRDDLKKVQLGETMIELAGDARLRVSTGIISDLQKDEAGNISGLSISGVESAPGSPVVSLDGALIAITTKNGWVPVTAL